jgi:hypothetical protein
MPDPIWDREFARLRENYRDRLPEQIERLDEILRRARASESPHRELEAACQLTHQLRGTSGSYGFEDSCAAFERIEVHLDALNTAVPAEFVSVWAEIEQCLKGARMALLE